MPTWTDFYNKEPVLHWWECDRCHSQESFEAKDHRPRGWNRVDIYPAVGDDGGFNSWFLCPECFENTWLKTKDGSER